MTFIVAGGSITAYLVRFRKLFPKLFPAEACRLRTGPLAAVRGGRRRRLFRNASLVRGRCGKRPLSGGRGAFRSFPTGGTNVRSSYRLSAGVCGCSFSSFGLRAVEVAFDFMGRRLFEVVFLLLDGGYFGGFVDLRIDVFYYVGLDILHGRGKVVPEFVVAFLQFGPVETDECHEFALLLRHDGVAYQKMAVQNAFDILRVDVLAVRPDYHAAEPPLDVEESVRVEGAEVARAESNRRV